MSPIIALTANHPRSLVPPRLWDSRRVKPRRGGAPGKIKAITYVFATSGESYRISSAGFGAPVVATEIRDTTFGEIAKSVFHG